ncbi:MAG: catalase-related domain-containing protein [Desulfatiglandaceae bacterium]
MSQEKTTADFEKSRQDKSSTPNEDSQLATGGELQQIIKQARIASVISFEFDKVEHLHVREALVEHLRRIDEGLAERVAKELALEKSSMRLK